MISGIPGIMQTTEKTYTHLVELQRFRHFKRYYFELEYDWAKIEYIVGQFDNAHPLAVTDLQRFKEDLRSL